MATTSTPTRQPIDRSPVDPAQQSLAEALRVSFAILKVAMLALLVGYAFSGTFSVGSNEVALRLRFGDYVGDPGSRVLERGTYLAAPFPIEEVVKVDTRPVRLPIEKEFWFETADSEAGLSRSRIQAMKAMPLNPLRDGSLITGDSNIVHAKWTLTWRISDPEAFLTNLGTRAAATELVRLVAQQGIVHAAARMSADDFLRGVVDRDLMIGGMQRRLDDVRSGITVDQLTLEKVSAPMRVAGSFDAVTTAESERAARVVAAQQDNSRVLGETAGEASAALLALISAYEAAVEEGDPAAIENLDSRIAKAIDSLSIDDRVVGGEVARRINAARAYRTQIVEKIASEAQTFEQLLPQFEKNPALVVSKLWEDAKQAILTRKDVETFYTVPGQLELQLNRDPALQKERQKQQLRSKRDEERRARDAR